MIKNLNIISNEKVSTYKNDFYCDNIDFKSIPEGLEKSFKINLFARTSTGKKSHHVKVNSVILASNIFIFINNIFKVLKNENSKYLIISITPYTFLVYCLLILFKKKPFVYLRSSGEEEYRYILGYFGKFIYYLMFYLVALGSNFISCNSRILLGKKGSIVSPSQLTESWFAPFKKNKLDKIKLLYVGRIKVEKGIFSLLKIIKNLNLELELTIISAGKTNITFDDQKNIKVLNYENKNNSIIEVYDNHNIFVLPSYTEGHPQVLDEALARGKPVIIFEEIGHVIGDRKGVFVSKRKPKYLKESINYIINNYESIQNKMIENELPNKKIFLEEIKKIINTL